MEKTVRMMTFDQFVESWGGCNVNLPLDEMYEDYKDAWRAGNEHQG